MRMTELMLAIGDDNIEFQNLDHCATALNYNKGTGTKITFGTSRPLTPDGTDKLGLIVWLDRKAVADAVAASKPIREREPTSREEFQRQLDEDDMAGGPYG